MGIPTKKKTDRNAKIIDAYFCSRMTMDQIAKKHRLTRQRVYQVIQRFRLEQAEVKTLDTNPKQEYTGIKE